MANLLAELAQTLRRISALHTSEHSIGLYSTALKRSDLADLMRDAAAPKGRPAGAASASVQDYLAAIYDLAGSGQPVIGARLAKHMGISAPAVTEAIQRMVRGKYVKVGAGKELALTARGREIAEVMARRHRLLERWLTDTLGLNWTDAHEEAHRLEHAISPRVEIRLAELLGMPSTCPHGNPIPGMSKPRPVEPFPLAQTKEGMTVIVERITEEAEADKSLLAHLWKNNVRPGRRLKITEVAPWAGTITASGDGQTIALGLPAAGKIWVYAPAPGAAQ
jgi:DtxR family Mn-dependent transcriptional regulator